MKKGKWLLNPIVVLISMMLGVTVGLLQISPLVTILRPIGMTYMSLLQMSVIPIMVSAITVSIYRMIKSNNTGNYLKRVIITYVTMTVLTICICLSIGQAFLKFAYSTLEARYAATQIIAKDKNEQNQAGFIEIDSHRNDKMAQSKNALEMLADIVPQNIFNALASGENLKLIFFFIVLSAIAAKIAGDKAEPIIKAFESIYEIFTKFIGGLMYALPIGIFSLTADQFSKSGAGQVLILAKMILLIVIVIAVIFALSVVVISKTAKISIKEQFRAMYSTIMISVGTCNSMASIPNALKALTSELKINEDVANSVFPLGVSLCRYGNIAVYAVGVVFTISIYGSKIGFDNILIILLGILVASVATSGGQGVVIYPMIGMVLGALDLPSQIIIALLIAIDPIIDPIMTLANVYPNCAAAAVVDYKKETAEGGASVCAITGEV